MSNNSVFRNLENYNVNYVYVNSLTSPNSWSYRYRSKHSLLIQRHGNNTVLGHPKKLLWYLCGVRREF